MAHTGRVSKEQSDLNHIRILSISSRLFRQNGFDGVSLKDIMVTSGLTHGGFYGHFSSKDELERLACEVAFNENMQKMSAYDETDFTEFVTCYLSTQHRDNLASGCAITALSVDVQRKAHDKPVHKAYICGMNKIMSRFRELNDIVENHNVADRHLMQFAMMVGALTLARATRGNDLSERFLNATKSALLRNESHLATKISGN